MSVRVMTWVWDAHLTPTQKLTLLAIADCANDEGTDAYPSVARLCRKTCLSERAVQTAIGDLVKAGHLSVHQNAGPRGCNRYRVTTQSNGGPRPAPEPSPAGPPPQELHPAGAAPPHDVPPAGDAPPAPGAPRISRPPHDVPPTPASGAGVPPHDVRPNRPLTVHEPSEEQNPLSSPAAPTGRRGTRIPDDFTVSPEMRAWAKEHVPQLAGAGETEKFVDYWRAKAGKDGVKLDWPATWRNWMREAARRSANDRGGRPAAPASSAPVFIPVEDRCPIEDHRGQRKGRNPETGRPFCRNCASLEIGKPVPVS